MKWYSRDVDGKIDVSYANFQTDVDVELLLDSSTDVKEFLGTDLAGKIKASKLAINKSMATRFKQGIIWKFNNAGVSYTISIDENIQKLFSYTTTLRGKGRTNSHGGIFRQRDTRFNINDPGLEELSVFAGEWGLAIQRIKFDEDDAVEAMNIAQLDDYLANDTASQIDWSIDWSIDPQNNGMGWDNDTVMQNP